MSGWIGVDLDGTLAQYGGWVSEQHIGEPVPMMAARVRKWIVDGKDVRIFTARADSNQDSRDVDAIVKTIQDWTEKHCGARLPVTNKKDYGMVELWDDRAVQVIPNTGARADGQE